MYKWIIYFHHLCALLRCWADVRAPSYFVSLMLHSFFPPTYCHCSYLLACPTCNWVLKQKTIHDQMKWKQSVYIDKGICTQDFKEVRKSSVDREVFIFWLPDLSLIYWITRISFYFFWNFNFKKKKIVHHEFRANSTISYKNYPVIRLLEMWYIA